MKTNILLLIPVCAGVVCAQGRASFEVASIKPGDPSNNKIMMMMTPGGYRAMNVTVKVLIQQAYQIRDFQISGGPGWMSTERFDITAKTGAGEMTDEIRREMLQSLLADRFHLTVESSTKDLPAYSLVIAKGGIKFKEAAPEAPNGDGPADARVQFSKGGAGTKMRGFIRMKRGGLEADAVSVDALVNSLSNQLGRQVIDKTGLTGKYDFKIEWSPEGPPPVLKDGDAAPAVDSAGPSVFTALQEQLGLKLESTHAQTLVIVVGRLEKPSEN